MDHPSKRQPSPRVAVATGTLFLVAFLAALVFQFSYPLPPAENDASN